MTDPTQPASDQKRNRVWVVEVFHSQNRRWYRCAPPCDRQPSAHMLMRDKRRSYPREKFRTTKYESTVSSDE